MTTKNDDEVQCVYRVVFRSFRAEGGFLMRSHRNSEQYELFNGTSWVEVRKSDYQQWAHHLALPIDELIEWLSQNSSNSEYGHYWSLCLREML